MCPFQSSPNAPENFLLSCLWLTAMKCDVLSSVETGTAHARDTTAGADLEQFEPLKIMVIASMLLRASLS